MPMISTQVDGPGTVAAVYRQDLAQCEPSSPRCDPQSERGPSCGERVRSVRARFIMVPRFVVGQGDFDRDRDRHTQRLYPSIWIQSPGGATELRPRAVRQVPAWFPGGATV